MLRDLQSGYEQMHDIYKSRFFLQGVGLYLRSCWSSRWWAWQLDSSIVLENPLVLIQDTSVLRKDFIFVWNGNVEIKQDSETWLASDGAAVRRDDHFTRIKRRIFVQQL